MAYTAHTVIKPEKIVATGIGVLSQELTLPKLFMRKNYEDIKGALDDTLTFRVPGRLVPRRWAWRNNRSTPIVYDVYKEAKTTLTYGDRIYSAVKITDEQAQFDLSSPDALVPNQAATVARGLNTLMAEAIESAPYEFVIGGASAALDKALVEARKILNKVGVPDGQRILVVGSDFEAAMLNEPKLVDAQHVGPEIAGRALSDAYVGKVKGFTVVVDQTIAADAAFALVPSSFGLVTSTPYIPASAPAGATMSYEGFTLRWLRSWDIDYVEDRSYVDLFADCTYIKDLWLNPKQAIDATQDPDTTQVFARGVKLTLGGVSDYPNVGTYLGDETGLTTPWSAPV